MRERARILMHLNGGYTKVSLERTEGYGMADGGLTAEIPTKDIPPHARGLGSRLLVDMAAGDRISIEALNFGLYVPDDDILFVAQRSDLDEVFSGWKAASGTPTEDAVAAIASRVSGTEAVSRASSRSSGASVDMNRFVRFPQASFRFMLLDRLGSLLPLIAGESRGNGVRRFFHAVLAHDASSADSVHVRCTIVGLSSAAVNAIANAELDAAIHWNEHGYAATGPAPKSWVGRLFDRTLHPAKIYMPRSEVEQVQRLAQVASQSQDVHMYLWQTEWSDR